jgi:ribonuclease HI
MITYVLATDGGCAPTNPGPGTIAYVLEEVDDEAPGRSWMRETHVEDLGWSTNNRAELTAILIGLRRVHALRFSTVEGGNGPAFVTVLSDSQNAIGWSSGSFRINDPALRQVVQDINWAIEAYHLVVRWQYVNGHSQGQTWEERLNVTCDALIREHRKGAGGRPGR